MRIVEIKQNITEKNYKQELFKLKVERETWTHRLQSCIQRARDRNNSAPRHRQKKIAALVVELAEFAGVSTALIYKNMEVHK